METHIHLQGQSGGEVPNLTASWLVYKQGTPAQHAGVFTFFAALR